MNKLFIILLAFFLLIFSFRVYQNGGLNKQKAANADLQNLASIFEPLQSNLSKYINNLLPQPQAALLDGMLLGVKSNLPKDFNDNLKATSTIHIVVVSGQNLSMLIGFLMSFVTVLGRRKTILISFLITCLYCLLTGLQIPAIRAAIMVSLSGFAQLIGREKDGFWILLITAVLMLIYDPNWLLSISFQLSFLATIGTLQVAPKLKERLNFIPDILKEDLSVSFAAQLLTIPIIAANFHQISIIGLLANTLVLWTVSPVMITGALALVAGIINITLGQLFALVPGVLLTYFVYIINFFANLPLASIKTGDINYLVWIGYYLIMLAIYLSLKPNHISQSDSSLQGEALQG